MKRVSASNAKLTLQKGCHTLREPLTRLLRHTTKQQGLFPVTNLNNINTPAHLSKLQLQCTEYTPHMLFDESEILVKSHSNLLQLMKSLDVLQNQPFTTLFAPKCYNYHPESKNF